ncbi:MAG: dTDP-4-dehydrorhamnose reductase [Proteobacteria bacterium]|nr:dTDP-4-dehydrorhamnose reductase [Pseudomonadota bacterium]
MQTVVVIGRQGQLARELAALDWPVALRPIFLGRNEVNLLDTSTLDATLSYWRPAAIINAAAYTAVDRAESEPLLAMTLNADLPACLARLSAQYRVPLLHVSTDYVFSGDSARLYCEEDSVLPLSVYGQSKLAGETAVLGSDATAVVIRTASLFGRYGQNFLKTMVTRSTNPQPIQMVADQVSSPTPTALFARALQQMARDLVLGHRLPRLLHLAGQPESTWFAFTNAIFAALRHKHRGCLPELRPVRLSTLTRPAVRPLYSALDSRLAASLGYDLPQWRIALPPLIDQLTNEKVAA